MFREEKTYMTYTSLIMIGWRWQSPDTVHIEDDDSWRTPDKKVDKSWRRTWRSKRSVAKIAFSKTLFVISWCRIVKDDGFSFLITTSMPTACIYREDQSSVTVSHNRLGLSLSKCIRHELVTKINDKRKLQTYETLGWISADYPWTLCVRAHRLASARPARWGKWTYFSLPHSVQRATHASIHLH
jgi:hypothetical protein